MTASDEWFDAGVSSGESAMSTKIHEQVTARIIAELEHGAVPWVFLRD